MQRRSFLTSILALGAAPAIVKADSLMRIVPPKLMVPGRGFVISQVMSFPPPGDVMIEFDYGQGEIYRWTSGVREQMEGRVLRPSADGRLYSSHPKGDREVEKRILFGSRYGQQIRRA